MRNHSEARMTLRYINPYNAMNSSPPFVRKTTSRLTRLNTSKLAQ